MKRSTYKSKELLPLSVIDAARDGDSQAVDRVLRYYEGYINKLCTRTLYDPDGQPHVRVDEYMKRRLEIKLMQRKHSGFLLQRRLGSDTHMERPFQSRKLDGRDEGSCTPKNLRYLSEEETELHDITVSVIEKLNRLTDAEFDDLDLMPDTFEKDW